MLVFVYIFELKQNYYSVVSNARKIIDKSMAIFFVTDYKVSREKGAWQAPFLCANKGVGGCLVVSTRWIKVFGVILQVIVDKAGNKKVAMVIAAAGAIKQRLARFGAGGLQGVCAQLRC